MSIYLLFVLQIAAFRSIILTYAISIGHFQVICCTVDISGRVLCYKIVQKIYLNSSKSSSAFLFKKCVSSDVCGDVVVSSRKWIWIFDTIARTHDVNLRASVHDIWRRSIISQSEYIINVKIIAGSVDVTIKISQTRTIWWFFIL